MSDLDREELGALAPGVDVEASLALFERRRRRDRRSRRVAQAAVAVVALAAVGTIALAGRDVPGGDQVAGPTPGSSDPVSVTLDVELGGAYEYGSVRLFEEPAFWQGAIGDEPAPRIDFRHWVVVALTNDVMRCGAHLSGFARDGETLTPIFAPGPLTGPPEGPWLCTLAAHPETHVAAVWRAALDPSFAVRVPEGPYVGPETLHPFVVEATRTTPAEAEPAIGFDIVDVRRAPPTRAGDIRVIEDEAALRDTWGELGLGRPHAIPSLDLDQQLVLMLTTSGGACRPELRGFSVEGAALLPVLHDVDDPACGHEMTAHTFVVTLDRATVAELESIALDGDTLLGIAPTARNLDGAESP